MKNHPFRSLPLLALGLSLLASTSGAATLTFTQLTGTVGGTPALTAVFKASLAAATSTNILSITIEDASFGLGGSGGKFSGFDLDAIKISSEDCATAACASTATALAAFNFTTGVVFQPGVQRAPADPKLFGTGPTGNTLDNAVATLGSFDGNSTIDATAFGFISLGDGGTISFNLTQAVNPTGLFLYIGEVGNNGEVAASGITVSDREIPAIPEPSTFALMGGGLALAWFRSRR